MMSASYFRTFPIACTFAFVLAFAPLLSAPVIASPKDKPFADLARKIGEGDFQSPRFSPDGTRVLVSGAKQHGLWEVQIQSGATTRITDALGSGKSGRYLEDGRIGYDETRAGIPSTLAVDKDGAREVISVASQRDRRKVFAHRDEIYLRREEGALSKIGNGDRFFQPSLSPSATWVSFVGLQSGVYVHNIKTGETLHLGRGTAPAWGPNDILVFERSYDDGHKIHASDLWLWRPTTRQAQQLTHTEQRIERHPAISRDGKAVAFDDNRGGIYVMPLSAQEVSR